MDGQLSAISNIVVLMLENRSFDHMLGFLYADSGNVAPTGQAFEGLKGTESNSDGNGGTVQVYKVDTAGQYAYSHPAPIQARGTPQPTRSCSVPIRLPLLLSPPTAVS
jgi:phospholipase C